MSGVEDIDLGFDSALDRIQRMDNVGVKVGILGSAGDHKPKDHKPRTGAAKAGLKKKKPAAGAAHEGSSAPQSVAEIAAHHEFGAPEANIPQRSFLRAGIDGAQSEIGTAVEELTKKVIDGAMTAEVAAARLGLVGVRAVQRKLIDGPFVPLSEKTIKAKGSSRPLIDTGQMRRSVMHEVVTDMAAAADEEGAL
jgi:hypothetical protein